MRKVGSHTTSRLEEVRQPRQLRIVRQHMDEVAGGHVQRKLGIQALGSWGSTAEHLITRMHDGNRADVKKGYCADHHWKCRACK
jgi:hypothetical protein